MGTIHQGSVLTKYKNLPVNVAQAGPIVIVQIPGYATGMGDTLETAVETAIKGFLTEFFKECAHETTD